jgi:hypothetical protein
VSYKSFHLTWCWVWLVSLWERLVSHPLRYDWIEVRIDVVLWARFVMVETVGIRQVMWIVMLESAKDRILWVDTPGQHVPPRVRYGTVCWLTRKALVSLSCWKSGIVWLYLWDRKVQEGHEGILLYPNGGNLSNCERGLRIFCCTQQGETYSKARHTSWG